MDEFDNFDDSDVLNDSDLEEEKPLKKKMKMKPKTTNGKSSCSEKNELTKDSRYRCVKKSFEAKHGSQTYKIVKREHVDNPYITFSKKQRPFVKKEHPNWKQTDIVKEIAKRWNASKGMVKTKKTMTKMPTKSKVKSKVK